MQIQKEMTTCFAYYYNLYAAEPVPAELGAGWLCLVYCQASATDRPTDTASTGESQSAEPGDVLHWAQSV